MAGSVLVNIALLAVATVACIAIVPQPLDGPARNLGFGFLAAAAVLVVLIIIRRFFVIRPTDTLQRMGWLLAIAVAEETAKVIATTSLREKRYQSRKNRRAIHGAAALRGWGFAGAEHLLYLALTPFAFITRIVTAGFLHTATTLYYTLPRRGIQGDAIAQRGRAYPNIFLRFMIAVAVHTAYNLTLTSLDSIRLIW